MRMSIIVSMVLASAGAGCGESTKAGKLRSFVQEMCACTDVHCAEKVDVEFGKFAAESRELSDDERSAMPALQTEYRACTSKLGFRSMFERHSLEARAPGSARLRLPDGGERAFAGLAIEAPADTTMEAAQNGTDGPVVAVATRTGRFRFSLDRGTAIADEKRHAASDPLAKFVKFHEDTPSSVLWQGESTLSPGAMEHRFVATIRVGDGRSFECSNKARTDIDLTTAQQLLAICRSLATTQ